MGFAGYHEMYVGSLIRVNSRVELSKTTRILSVFLLTLRRAQCDVPGITVGYTFVWMWSFRSWEGGGVAALWRWICIAKGRELG